MVISSLEGHYQMAGGGQQRVQEQLAVFAGQVPVPHHGRGQQQVVAHLAPGPRKDPVVQAQQAHHPMGYGAHRYQRADGHVAGTEVGPGGPAP